MNLTAILDLIAPEALDSAQFSIHLLDVTEGDVTTAQQRPDMPLKESGHVLPQVLTFCRQPHPDRTAIMRRLFLFDIAVIV